MNHPVSKPRMPTGQPFDLSIQCRFVGAVAPAVP